MTNTIRWWHKPQNRFRMDLKNSVRCSVCGERHYFSIYRIWKERNPFWYRKENKKFRTEQHKKVRHQNKILLRKGMDPDRKIEHTHGWGSN